MDTWETVPYTWPNPSALYKWTRRIQPGIEASELSDLSWAAEQTLAVWVSGCLIPPDNCAYAIGGVTLENGSGNVALPNRMAQEDEELYGRSVPDRLRVSFCLAIRNDGQDTAHMEEMLRGLQIRAVVRRTDYHIIDGEMLTPGDAAYASAFQTYNVVVDMAGATQRRLDKEEPMTVTLVSLEADTQAKPEGDCYRVAKDFIDAGAYSFWIANGQIAGAHDVASLEFAYLGEEIRLDYRFSPADTDQTFSLMFAVPYDASEVSRSGALDILEASGMVCLLTFEPHMICGNYAMGPFYSLAVETSPAE